MIHIYIYIHDIYIYVLGAHFVACRSRSSLLVSTWLYTEFLGRGQWRIVFHGDDPGCLEMLNGLGFRVFRTMYYPNLMIDVFTDIQRSRAEAVNHQALILITLTPCPP